MLPGHASPLAVRASVRSGEVTRIQLEVPSASFLSGRVLDATDRRPIAGARLHLSGIAEGGKSIVYTSGAASTSYADGSGRFRIGSAPEGSRLVVSHPGYEKLYETLHGLHVDRDADLGDLLLDRSDEP